jgi:transcriptional regulator with XRE-family HTH domain
MATLQQQVQQYLQNTGISLRELSRRSGVSHTTISKILRGGEYKSSTENSLLFAMIFYSGDTARPVMQDKAAETLQDKVEQLAADRVDCDLVTRDDALECGKQRRIEALEAEVSVWRDKADKAGLRVSELDMLVQRRDAELNDANVAYLSSKSQHERDLQLLSDAQNSLTKAEALTQVYSKDLQTMRSGWKAACVENEQFQKQIDHGRAQLKSLHEAYDQQVMRLRVYIWTLIAALVFVLASGFVILRGAV